MTDQQFRQQVRAEAIAAGHSAAVADFLAKQVGKNHEPTKPPAGTRAGMTAPAARGDYMARMCTMYGAEHLAPALRGAGLTIRHAAALLAEATGAARSISPAGSEWVRIQIFALARKGGAQ